MIEETPNKGRNQPPQQKENVSNSECSQSQLEGLQEFGVFPVLVTMYKPFMMIIEDQV
jgi:hypothetical protein